MGEYLKYWITFQKWVNFLNLIMDSWFLQGLLLLTKTVAIEKDSWCGHGIMVYFGTHGIVI